MVWPFWVVIGITVVVLLAAIVNDGSQLDDSGLAFVILAVLGVLVFGFIGINMTWG